MLIESQVLNRNPLTKITKGVLFIFTRENTSLVEWTLGIRNTTYQVTVVHLYLAHKKLPLHRALQEDYA